MAGWPRVEAVPGARETLAELRLEWMIALATNAADSTKAEIRSALRRGRLNDCIDRVYCFRAVGHRKSEPEYFEHVLEDLGLARDDVVMVGDGFEGDVLTANRAGIRAVWFDLGGSDKRAADLYRTIHDLRELPGVLQRLLK